MTTPTIPYYPMTHDDGLDIIEALSDIKDAIYSASARSGTVYGFHINANESDPEDAVTYIEDAVGLTPAYMDYSNNRFVYGSWENAFFMPKPCMLKYNGTVDYYLDPDDYTKQIDGVTASDVANASYGGNAMMEWGQNGKKIWYKIVPDGAGSSVDVYIADYRVDDDYHAWSFINSANEMVDHFYTPIYNGSIDSSGRLRSISGIARSESWAAVSGHLCEFGTAQQERDAARLNGSNIWDTEVYADTILINLLLTLMSKSLDVQTAFGQGCTSPGQSGVLTSGTGNTLGMFYGYSDTTHVVKVFGMENWWGNLWRRFGGLVNDNGTMKYKLTRGVADGSKATDYAISATSSDYANYLVGNSLPAASGSYVSQYWFNKYGAAVPKAVIGTAATFYCDALWTNNGQVDYACRGGSSSSGSVCGAWCLSLSIAVSNASWNVGAAPSCKPLS